MAPAGRQPVSLEEQAHPKYELYTKVYIPLTIRWFEALETSPAKKELLTAALRRPLVESLENFNDLCRQLIGELLDESWAEEMVRVAHRLHNDILWVGDEGPGPDPTLQQVKVALVAKLRRNISLGVLEAVLCLESAYHHAKNEWGLTGDELRESLQRSNQLYASLAVLHDEQERQRLTFLTGRHGYLEYPAVDYPDVVDHERDVIVSDIEDVVREKVRIAKDKFLPRTPTGAPRLRFVSRPVNRDLNSPTMRCPAHQPSTTGDGGTLNDLLWRLLIDIYQRSGRFD